MVTLTNTQLLITIAVIALGTILTRALPFLIFPPGRETPRFIRRLQRLLPSAVIGLLVVYCLRNVEILTGSHGLPELIAIAVIVVLHLIRKNTLLSISGGTVVYMLLVQTIFSSGA